MTLRQRLRAHLDPDRFCPCGRERVVAAVRKTDRRTGEGRGLIWGAACPEIGLTFRADGSGTGNGLWGHGHTGEVDCYEPTWLPEDVRQRIAADADAFGSCR